MIIRRVTFCAVVVIALSLAVLAPKKAHAFSGTGDGLDEGTTYLITNCTQLQEVNDDLGAWYRLGNDIDCSATASWNSGAGFEPIGREGASFFGVLRGDNHTITGLTINRPATDYVGLFGYIGSSGSVDRLRLKDTSVVGKNCVGSVAGQTVSGDVFNIGVDGEVTGTAEVGGVVGCNIGLIMNVYSRVNIGGNPTAAGGLVGYCDTPILFGYSTGFVPDGENNGGLVGVITDTNVSNSFWDTETSGQATSAAGTGKTSAQLKTAETFTELSTPGLTNTWDFVGNPNDDTGNANFWNINPLLNNGYPYLVTQTPDVPDTFITSLPSNPTSTPALTFEFSTNVYPATFECTLDGLEYAPCTSPYVGPPLADGEHSFSVRATNADGMTDQTPASTAILVDTVAPVTLLSLTDPPVGRDTSIYEFSSDDPSATFECSFNQATYEPCTSPYTTPVLVDGINTLEVRATDTAGNVEDPPASDTWNMVVDSDGDGIRDSVENAGPNNGDANHDSVLDAEQANVYSAPNIFVGDAYQVLETDCDTISNIVTGDPQYVHDAGFTYQMGLNDFQVSCPDPGMTAHISMYNYGVTFSPNYVLRKQAFVNGAYQYSTISDYQLSNPTIGSQSVTKVEYDVLDGGALDLDGQADGTIYDPVGLALAASSSATPTTSTPVLAQTGDNVQQIILLAAVTIFTPLLFVVLSRKQAVLR